MTLRVKIDVTGLVIYIIAHGAIESKAMSQLNTGGGAPSDTNVTGPSGGSSTDNAVARWDGTSGTLLQDSGVLVDDSDNMTGGANITISGDLLSTSNEASDIGAAGTAFAQAHVVKAFLGEAISGSVGFSATNNGIAGGYSTGTNAGVSATDDGGMAFGFTQDAINASTATLTSSNQGALVYGSAVAFGGTSTIAASGAGSFGGGASVFSGSITSSGIASFVWTHAAGGGVVTASGDGSFCLGQANPNDMTASGDGAGCFGRTNGGNVVASANGAIQFGPGTNATADSVQVGSNILFESNGNMTIGGDLNHDGSNVGFYGTAPAAQSAAYSPTNVSTDRAYDANATTVDELADVLGTLIADLQATGLIG